MFLLKNTQRTVINFIISLLLLLCIILQLYISPCGLNLTSEALNAHFESLVPKLRIQKMSHPHHWLVRWLFKVAFSTI